MPDEKKDEKSVTELLDEAEEQTEESNEEQDEKKEESKVKKPEKKEDENESDEDEQEVATALETYRILNDPKKGKVFLANLAAELGLEITERASSRTENKIKSALKERLGDKYDESHEVIGDLLESVVGAIRNDVKSELQASETRRAKASLNEEFNKFASENKLTDREANKMNDLIKDMPPNPERQVSLSKYLDRLLTIVRPQSTSRSSRERVDDNSRRRVENLSTDVQETRLKIGSRRPTVKEAVRAASLGIRFDEESGEE